MERPLELMLDDGFPDIPFCLNWANENWTSRWDGKDGSAVLMEQTYEMEHWRSHFEWLLPFIKHPQYIRWHDKPIIMMYRAADVPLLRDMLLQWQAWAFEEGVTGIFFVQINGSPWKDGAYDVQPGMDAVAEFYPNYYGGSGYGMNNVSAVGVFLVGKTKFNWYSRELQVLSSKQKAPVHFYGACAAFDSTPRHAKSMDSAGVLPSHPSIFKYWMRQNLARTEPGGIVLVNAWNEWGEGEAIEPSVQWGHRWLEAIRDALAEDTLGEVAQLLDDGFAASIPLKPAGIEKRCVLICTCICVFL